MPEIDVPAVFGFFIVCSKVGFGFASGDRETRKVEFKPFVKIPSCTTYDVYADGTCYGFVYRDKGADGVRMRWEGEFNQPTAEQRKAIVEALAKRYPNEHIEHGEAKWPATIYHPDLPHTYGARPSDD